MSYLNFKLSNARLAYEVQKQSERWSLYFDASIERPERSNTFMVYIGGKGHDGYKMEGKLYIEHYALPPSPQPEKYYVHRDQGPGYFRIGTIPPESQGPDPIGPRIELGISLLSDNFFRLYKDSVDKSSLELCVSFPLRKGENPGFTFGLDPDGRDLEYYFDESSDPVYMEYVRFTMTPNGRDETVPEPEDIPESTMVASEPANHSPVSFVGGKITSGSLRMIARRLFRWV